MVWVRFMSCCAISDVEMTLCTYDVTRGQCIYGDGFWGSKSEPLRELCFIKSLYNYLRAAIGLYRYLFIRIYIYMNSIKHSHNCFKR